MNRNIPTEPASAVFRVGLATYTKIFCDTLDADNVRMNNVLPGWTDSPPTAEERRRSAPLGRYGTAGEAAATVAFFASEGAANISEQNIHVDGRFMRRV